MKSFLTLSLVAVLVGTAGTARGSPTPPLGYDTGYLAVLPGFDMFWHIDTTKNTTIDFVVQVPFSQGKGWVGIGVSEIFSGTMPGADMAVITYDTTTPPPETTTAATTTTTTAPTTTAPPVADASTSSSSATSTSASSAVDSNSDSSSATTSSAAPTTMAPTPVVGGPTLRDMFATGFTTPVEDFCGKEEWVLKNFSTNATHIEYHMSRSLKVENNTAFDRDFETGLSASKMLFAYSDTSAELTYHGVVNRAIHAVELLPAYDEGLALRNFEEIKNTTQVFTLQSDNYAIPAQETTYHDTACLRPPSQQDGQDPIALAIEAFSQPGNEKFIHHVTVKAYTNAFCFGVPITIAASASRPAPFRMPEEVGLKLNVYAAYRAEIHYDNPAFISGAVDSSGVRLYYNYAPIKHEAAMLQLGDPFVRTSQGVPAGLSSYTYTCPSKCLDSWQADEITIFSQSFHMHSVGYRMNMTVRNGTTGALKHQSQVDFFNFDTQGNEYMVPYKVQKGDVLENTCSYKVDKNRVPAGASGIEFGLDSDEEMCINFIMYYPRQTGTTGWICGEGELNAFCGDPVKVQTVNSETDFEPYRKFGLLENCPGVTTAEPPATTTATPTTTSAVGSSATTFTAVPNLFDGIYEASWLWSSQNKMDFKLSCTGDRYCGFGIALDSASPMAGYLVMCYAFNQESATCTFRQSGAYSPGSEVADSFGEVLSTVTSATLTDTKEITVRVDTGVMFSSADSSSSAIRSIFAYGTYTAPTSTRQTTTGTFSKHSVTPKAVEISYGVYSSSAANSGLESQGSTISTTAASPQSLVGDGSSTGGESIASGSSLRDNVFGNGATSASGAMFWNALSIGVLVLLVVTL